MRAGDLAQIAQPLTSPGWRRPRVRAAGGGGPPRCELPGADEGSGGGEPAAKRDEDRRTERKEAGEQFLNEVWSTP